MVQTVQARVPERVAEPDLIGASGKFRLVLDQVRIVAPTDCAVLIQGETGTGKELIARISTHPRVTVFCFASFIRQYPQRPRRKGLPIVILVQRTSDR